MKQLILIGTILFLGGCASQKNIYEWGSYSTSLYKYKKDPTEEKLILHIQNLESIIEVASQKNKQVPPGVYAELGFYKEQSGDPDKASEYYYLEKKTYPESSFFMDQLINATSEGDK